METTIHRQLKELYAPDASGCEVSVDGYRIDAVDGDRLIEIQQASLGAIRDKIRTLLESHDVTVVKPLAARKYLIKRARKRGRIVSKRYSPVRETIWHLFADLVHFVNVFPHPRLTLEVVFTEQEEHRLPKKKKRWRRKDYRVEDRLLREVTGIISLETVDDLIDLLPASLPAPFSTADLAREAEIPRWLAQKTAYCLRKTNAVTLAGKDGNALLYEVVSEARRAA
jgi:hypothetical protein